MPRIVLENLSVCYPVFQDYYKSICRAILHIGSGGRLYNQNMVNREIHALKDITFELGQSDRVALIGHNGAGKSTLLRAIGGIIAPNSGTLNVEGTVMSMFSSDGGMDMDQTGYDNIFILGRLYGVHRSAMEKYIPAIEAFSELGEFLNMPVCSYSNGMKVRLGIAVISCLHPDILIMDEVIGAGDVHFIIKAMENIQKIYERASIILMASHSLEILTRLCTSAIWLDHGRVVKMGAIHEIMEEYKDSQKP